MSYEVELKFPVDDPASLSARVKALGGIPGPTIEQSDVYFAHPSRDFVQTDEALRVRTTDDETRITYKGPKIDPLSKTRREIELPVGSTPQAGEQLATLLECLGFRRLRPVRKLRTPWHFIWEGRRLEIVFDDVCGLGRFVEIETQADEATREAARDSILRLADELGLKHSERRSYLCLLIERDQE